MNYTTNHHLPQWVKEDRIMMDDFNQMCLDIEAGLNKTAVNAAADTAKASAQAAAAQKAADQAAASAAAAQATADAAYCATNQPYILGTYTGTETEQNIYLGFQPKFLFIMAPDQMYSYYYFSVAGCGLTSPTLVLTATGFTVLPDKKDNAHATLIPPNLNVQLVNYLYIAFR